MDNCKDVHGKLILVHMYMYLWGNAFSYLFEIVKTYS